MSLVEIPLQQLLKAVDDCAPQGCFICDPQGNSATFFKYKGTLIDTQDERDRIPQNVRARVRGALYNGTTLAVFVANGTDGSSLFGPECIPREVMHRDHISQEVLDSFKAPEDIVAVLSDSYRFAIVVPQLDVPEWGQELIDQGLLCQVNII